MIIEVDRTKKCLVRGYFVYADRQAGCIGFEQAKDEKNFNVGVAYTMWHRTDDDFGVKQVQTELEAIARVYGRFHDFAGGMYGYEYRDFTH